jgi:hypothetical protein
MYMLQLVGGLILGKDNEDLRVLPPILSKSDMLKFRFFTWRALQLKRGHSYTPNVPFK